MDTSPTLKEQARTRELSGDYQGALELYTQLEEQSPEADPYLSLHKGQLQQHLGQAEDAASSLFRTVDLLVERGLINSALAVCHRLQQLFPDYAPVYLRLAELGTQGGYRQDARFGLLGYAERAAHEDAEAVREALEQYLRRFPNDGEVRAQLRDYLYAPGGTEPEPDTFIGSQPALDTTETLRPQTGSSLLGDSDDLLPEEPAEPDLGILPTLLDATPEAQDEVAPLEGLLPTLSGPAAEERSAEEEEAEDDEGEELPLLGSDFQAGTQVDEPDLAESEIEEMEDFPLLGALPLDEEETTPLRSADVAEPADTLLGEETDLLGESEDEDESEDVLPLLGSQEEAEAAGEVEARGGGSDDLLGALEPPESLPEEVEETLEGSLAEMGPPHETELPLEEPQSLLEEPESFQEPEKAEPEPDEDDLESSEELSLFRKQVAEQVAPEDAAAHYDLGLAFKEMGLLDDAIGELRTALRAGANPLAASEVLGECYLERGEPTPAIRVLQSAATTEGVTDEDLVGVYYWLARSEELLGNSDAAVSYYKRVLAVDPAFRDAGRRLEGLGGA